jgi:hypothetical protein
MLKLRRHKVKIALLVSGNTRTLSRVQSNISKLVDDLENTNNADVDVYMCLDEQINHNIKNVVQQRYDKSNISKGAKYNNQMHRWNICFNSIYNINEYDWFIRTRPDLKIIDFNPHITLLDKQCIHVRFRKSIDELSFKKSSIQHQALPRSIINVVDDQFVIAHKSIAKDVFSITFGNKPIVRDDIDHWPEHIFTYMLNSHNIPFKPIELITHIIR